MKVCRGQSRAGMVAQLNEALKCPGSCRLATTLLLECPSWWLDLQQHIHIQAAMEESGDKKGAGEYASFILRKIPRSCHAIHSFIFVGRA